MSARDLLVVGAVAVVVTVAVTVVLWRRFRYRPRHVLHECGWCGPGRYCTCNEESPAPPYGSMQLAEDRGADWAAQSGVVPPWRAEVAHELAPETLEVAHDDLAGLALARLPVRPSRHLSPDGDRALLAADRLAAAPLPVPAIREPDAVMAAPLAAVLSAVECGHEEALAAGLAWWAGECAARVRGLAAAA